MRGRGKGGENGYGLIVFWGMGWILRREEF